MQPNRLVQVKHLGARILVVDDEESICTMLSRMLEPFGYTVDIAMDADAALRRLKRSRADVVLCDIRMPGHDGFWLIEQLQQKYPATAIIIATGLKDLDPRLTLRPGITGYLIKPFSLDDVQTAVQQAVAAVRALTPKSTLRLVEPPSSSES